MPDHISAHFNTKPFLASLRAMERRVDRATMWALREVAREVRKEAGRYAPVGDGSDPREKPGQLKRSVRASRRIKRIGPHTFELVIGPRGDHVHLYASKAEKRTRFMARAYNAVLPSIPALHRKAWQRAIDKR